jgi:hypothetical protein
MTDTGIGQPTPQFGTAEYVGTPGGDHCHFCHQPIGATYFRTNDAMTCPSCAQKMSGALAPDSHSAFVKSVLFGVGAAILGMVLYATFAIVTGIVIGYASLAVGWIVGKAMITGSNGVGGRRYQIVAVLLTYAAVSTAAIPIWIHYADQPKKSTELSHQETSNSSSGSGEQESSGNESNRRSSQGRPNFVAAMGTLIGLGLVSPFLELSGNPLSGIIGLVILFVGMRFAWRFTEARAPAILGPFENSPKLS